MRKKSWGEHKKSWLDKLIERVRFSLITKEVSGNIVLDLGCGYNASFLRSIIDKGNKFVGIDLRVNKSLNSKYISLINTRVDQKIPLKSNSFDTVTSMAVIEHVEFPTVMLREIHRLLKLNGVLLLTTPSSYSKPILELLAFKLKLISSEEISDHKRYYNTKSLRNELIRAGFKPVKIRIKTFLGMNIFAKATK